MASLIPPGSSKERYYEVLPLEKVFNNRAVSDPTKGFSAVYRNEAVDKELVPYIHPDLNTYHALFSNAAKMYAEKSCLGARKYDYKTKTSADVFDSFTYAEINERKKDLGSGILYSLQHNPFLAHSEVHSKIRHHQRDFKTYGLTVAAKDNKDYELENSVSFVLSIFSANRLEWTLTDLACAAYSITNTALYDNLGPDVTKYILELTKSPVIACSADKIPLLLQFKEEHPELTKEIISILSMDPLRHFDSGWVARAHKAGIVLTDYEQIEALGHKHRIAELPPKPESLFTISFTSGTTGSKPKGAMLSHANAAAGLTALAATIPHAGLKPDRAFIFLPLTHIYERQTSGFGLLSGYYLGYPQLTVGAPPKDAFKSLTEDLRIFKPTYFSIVPRILTKVESHVKQLIEDLSEEERTEIYRIIEKKIEIQSSADGATGENYYYDNYAPYKNLKRAIGFDNLLWTQSASAPVAPSTIIFLKAALGIGIRQLYGMTECYAALTSTDNYDSNPGSCGAMGVSGEFKLSEVASMGHLLKDGRGELLLRGPVVFKGYYYNIEETKKTFDDEGWLHTGDIAAIDPVHFRISIIDRVKNFFKLAQGEYVSPEKVENRYLSSNPILTQLFVHGDSVRPYLVGVAGVDYEHAKKFLIKECGYEAGFSPSVVLLLKEMNKVDIKAKFLAKLNKNVAKKLNRLELVHNIHIDINPLTVERNVVTPTHKIKRAIAAKFFHDVFHRLYEIEKSLIGPIAKL